MVVGDVLKYRGMQSQVVFSEVVGVLAGIIAGAVCVKFAGAGIVMYVVCLSVQLLVTIVFAAWSLSSIVGIHYLSVIMRTGGCVIVTFVIALVLYGVQRLIFTALGGLATFIICALLGLVLQLIAIFVLHIFDKDEFNNLPLPFITRNIVKFF